MRQEDVALMREALVEARRGEQTPGGAQVGCVIVEDGAVVCRAFNEGELRHDPTAHAEMVAIRRLCAGRKTTSIKGTTLYCTLQPCGMCTIAALWAGVSRIVYGATRSDVNSIYFATRHADTIDFIHDSFRSDLEIVPGVLAEECATLYIRSSEPAPPNPGPGHEPTVEV